MSDDKDWKLKLKFGEISTDHSHFTLTAPGIVDELVEGFECRKGKAIIAMKIWAEDIDEAVSMVSNISTHIGFKIDGNIEVYDTEPSIPPKQNSHAYDIQFTPYD